VSKRKAQQQLCADVVKGMQVINRSFAQRFRIGVVAEFEKLGPGGTLPGASVSTGEMKSNFIVRKDSRTTRALFSRRVPPSVGFRRRNLSAETRRGKKDEKNYK